MDKGGGGKEESGKTGGEDTGAEAGAEGGEQGNAADSEAAPAADLSSPRAAFDSFAARFKALTDEMQDTMRRLFTVPEHEIVGDAVTKGFHDFLKARAEKRQGDPGGDVDGPLEFAGKEEGGDGAVVIRATQENTRRKWKGGGNEDGPRFTLETKVLEHELRFVKSGSDWKIGAWRKECWACEGSGLCPECGGTGKTKPQDCFACGGSGKTENGDPCPACGGSGKSEPRECYACKDTGGKCYICKGEGFQWSRAGAGK